MSSNRGAEKPTLKYSHSSPCFHNSSWYLVKMHPSTSAGDVSPCFTGQIQVKSIVSEFKDWFKQSFEGMVLSGHDLHGKQAMDKGEGQTYSFYTMGQMVHITGRKQRNKDHKRRMDRVLKCK